MRAVNDFFCLSRLKEDKEVAGFLGMMAAFLYAGHMLFCLVCLVVQAEWAWLDDAQRPQLVD